MGLGLRKGVWVLLLSAAVWLGCSQAAVAARWRIQRQPTSTPSSSPAPYLDGVSCVSVSFCAAVGWYSNPSGGLAEFWDSGRLGWWLGSAPPTPAGGSAVRLHGVSCPSAEDCTAVGDYWNGSAQVTLAERWSHNMWSIEPTPNPTGTGQDLSLNSVSCPRGGVVCTAVGGSLIERWDGSKWSIEHPPRDGSGVNLEGVSCPSVSFCIAVGQHWSSHAVVTLVERWNGSKWSIEHSPNPADGSPAFLTGRAYLSDVSCPVVNVCTAVGRYRKGKAEMTLAERGIGNYWSIQHTPNPRGGRNVGLHRVSCPSVRFCTAVGDYNTASHARVTLAERWNGRWEKWTIEKMPNPPGGSRIALNGVSCWQASICTAIGDFETREGQATLAEHRQ